MYVNVQFSHRNAPKILLICSDDEVFHVSPLVPPGSGSFSLSGSADCFLGVPPMNGEQPPYHMGAQVRLSRAPHCCASAACDHVCVSGSHSEGVRGVTLHGFVPENSRMCLSVRLSISVDSELGFNFYSTMTPSKFDF